MRENRGADDHQHLRGEREDDRVHERGAEVRAVPDIDEVLQADPRAAERAGRRVGETEVDGKAERDADQQDDEQDRWANQRGGEKTALFEEVPPTPSS